MCPQASNRTSFKRYLKLESANCRERFAVPKSEGQPVPTPAWSSQVVSSLNMANTLFPTMTVREFENGYWYLDQLKDFAARIGVPAAKKLRKDELEKTIVAFLRTGTAALPTKRSLRR